MTRPIRLAALISGGGTTLQNFIDRIVSGEMSAEIAVVISSSATACGLQRAKAAGIPSAVVERKRGQSVEEFSEANFDVIRKYAPNLVCLAGYLKLLRIPDDYAGRVMNIHPALIPAFCGHGYYGHAVHEAAIDYGVKVSGCTVHFVNNEYDAGPIIIQRTVPVLENDTADVLAARVFREECIAYPLAIRLFQTGRLKVVGRKVVIA